MTLSNSAMAMSGPLKVEKSHKQFTVFFQKDKYQKYASVLILHISAFHSVSEWILIKSLDQSQRLSQGEGVQKNHEWKSPMVGRSNKIFQIDFGVLLKHIFPATESTFSVNKKWFICEKNHFLFSGQVKKMSLSQTAKKNGPKTQLWQKLTFFLTWIENWK